MTFKVNIAKEVASGVIFCVPAIARNNTSDLQRDGKVEFRTKEFMEKLPS